MKSHLWNIFLVLIFGWACVLLSIAFIGSPLLNSKESIMAPNWEQHINQPGTPHTKEHLTKMEIASTWVTRIEHSLPFVIGAIACFVVAVLCLWASIQKLNMMDYSKELNLSLK